MASMELLIVMNNRRASPCLELYNGHYLLCVPFLNHDPVSAAGPIGSIELQFPGIPGIELLPYNRFALNIEYCYKMVTLAEIIQPDVQFIAGRVRIDNGAHLVAEKFLYRVCLRRPVSEGLHIAVGIIAVYGAITIGI